MKSANAKNSGMNRGLALMVVACLLAVSPARADTVNLATLTGDYTAADGTTLTNTLSRNCKISIADGATITLEKAKILGTNSTSCQWAGLTCEGDATIILSGANTVRGFHSSYPAIHVPANKTLTIRGNGSLTASGNGNSAGIGGGLRLACGNIVVEDGTITATGGWGAGIGAGYGASCGENRIMGGTVTATGGNGSAGIGSGYNPDGSPTGSCGNILIAGGTVTATGADHGAGIGAGNKMSCGSIRLEGGLICATGGAYSAGIGGGWMGACGDIAITFGIDRITATMGESADAPIGKGYGAPCGTITTADGLKDVTRGPTRTMTSWDGFLAAMTHDAAALDGMTLFGTLTGNYKVSIADGATITLEGVNILPSRSSWAGLTCEGDATIILSGMNNVGSFNSDYPGIYVPSNKTLTIRGTGALTATSTGYGAAGIGAGYGNARACGNIIVESGTIRANGGDYAAGIGGGGYTSCGNIVIGGGVIISTGGNMASGIGGGGWASCGNINITGGTITAASGGYGTGIGSGGGGSDAICGDITISGGTISATGGDEAAGIGSSGYYSTCGNITIAGGTITATGGTQAAGIGSGYDNASCRNISIGGGVVVATAGSGAAGIGGGYRSACSNITIGANITRVTATMGESATPIGGGNDGSCGKVSIADSLEQIKSPDGTTLTLRPPHIYAITWLDDSGSEIDTTEVPEDVVPTHAAPLPTHWAESPYRYVFTGWTPEPVAATTNATYAATFAYVADLSLLDGDWSPADGDVLLPGETPYKVILPAGATVTFDGVALASDGSSPSAPTFADGGAGFLAGFAPAEGGNWTLEAYGNLSSGTAEGVTPAMVQVYAADTVEDLATASPLTSGVTLKDTQNAVKATLEVTPPSTSDTQFFRVQFSTE